MCVASIPQIAQLARVGGQRLALNDNRALIVLGLRLFSEIAY
jgi:hypothetical protein